MSRAPLRHPPRIAVLYPIPFGPGGIFGGGERYAVQLARTLARKVPTRLVTFGEKPARERVGELEVVTHRAWAYPRGERMNPLSLGFLRSLWSADVIHCTAWNTLCTDLATLFGHLRGKRVCVTDVGGGASLTLGGKLPLLRWIHRFLLIAPQGGAQFAAYRDRWSLIYAGIDTERYSPPAVADRRGVLFVGRLLPHKGIDVLVRAVPAGTPLTVVGRPYQPEYYQHLQELARGKDVTFVTAASDEEIIAFYRAAAVAVLPSVERTLYGDFSPLPELLGFTAMEAMSCGAAVIVTRVGGLPELMRDGETGYLVEPGNVAELEERIARLLADPALAARLGAAARRRIVEHFTWDSVAERCLEAYAQ
jgi:alpha-maltose-1-phosphate synthase